MQKNHSKLLIGLLVLGIAILAGGVYYVKSGGYDALLESKNKVSMDQAEETTKTEPESKDYMAPTEAGTTTTTDTSLNYDLDAIDTELSTVDPDDFSDDFSDIN